MYHIFITFTDIVDLMQVESLLLTTRMLDVICWIFIYVLSSPTNFWSNYLGKPYKKTFPNQEWPPH